MNEQSYYAQTCPTDNAVAVLKNLLYFLKVPVSPRDVEQAVYGHPDFPFISLYHLAEFLKSWQLIAHSIKINPQMLSEVALPAIAYTEKKQGAFVVLYGWDGKDVLYLNPAGGWITEPLEIFSQHWPGVLVQVSIPDTFTITPQPPVPDQRVGIALTLVNAEKTLASFIRYHLAIGFDHIFLFFDSSDDPSIQIADQFNQVTVIRRDASLENKWKACRLYAEYGHQLQRPEVRQLLNVEIAVHLAMEQRLDWLLQIDIDELFYSPHQTVKAHFAALTQEQVYHVTYLNYEAVSQKVEVEDYFREVTLFKKNPAVLKKAQQHTLLKFCTDDVKPWFLAYSNGKSAARVEKKLLPWGNHHFQLRQGRVTYQKKYKPATNDSTGSPVILHYAECGFSHFWRKYKTWGHFPDIFLGGQRIIDTVPFRIAARDVVKTGDEQLARTFYEKRVILQDSEVVDALLEKVILCRITGPSTILERTVTVDQMD